MLFHEMANIWTKIITHSLNLQEPHLSSYTQCNDPSTGNCSNTLGEIKTFSILLARKLYVFC